MASLACSNDTAYSKDEENSQMGTDETVEEEPAAREASFDHSVLGKLESQSSVKATSQLQVNRFKVCNFNIHSGCISNPFPLAKFETYILLSAALFQV